MPRLVGFDLAKSSRKRHMSEHMLQAYTDEYGHVAHRYAETFTYYVNGLEKQLWADLVKKSIGVRPRLAMAVW